MVVFGEGALKEVIKLDEALRVDPNLTGVLLNRGALDTHRNSRVGVHRGKSHEDTVRRQPSVRHRRASEETNPAGTLTLDSHLQTYENTFLLCNPHICGAFYWQLF